jgi:hypothetical protein
MIRCNKCNELKEEKQYSTYYHSTQKKHRIRKVCTMCFNEQKAIYRLRKKNMKMEEVPVQEIIIPPVEDLTPEIEYKECKKCKELLPVSEYYAARAGRYAGKPTSRCKVCHNENKKIEYRQKIEDNGGGLVVPMYPNTYGDEHQRVNTFLIMEALGWTFNENGVWSKEGIKDSNKCWSFTQRPDYVKFTNKNRPKEYPKIKHKSYARISEMNDLLEQGYPLYYICKEFGVARQTLRKMLQEYGKQES